MVKDILVDDWLDSWEEVSEKFGHPSSLKKTYILITQTMENLFLGKLYDNDSIVTQLQ